MRYFGGKARTSKAISGVLQSFEFQSYWEPFCGACNVLAKIEAPVRLASDAHEDLILMWKALQGGWQPPDTITEEEYLDLKTAPPSALRAVAGFGCSNSGKWFAGYARESTNRNFAMNAKRSLLKQAPQIQTVRYHNAPYQDVDTSFIPKIGPTLVYCDPPYAASTCNYNAGQFDSGKFWQWVRDISEYALVVVSEYEAPNDFMIVWEKAVRTDMKSASGEKIPRVEKLFSYRRPR
jgi:DNA adenine methylase